MLIEKLEVSGFRALNSVTLECEPLTAILGRNGSGKSSLLYALDSFYNVSAYLNQDDFYDRDTNTPVTIRVTYSRLTEEESTEFASYVQDGKLTVLKRFQAPGTGRYYASAPQVPEFVEIRKLGKRERVKQLKALIESNAAFSEIATSIPSAEVADQCMNEFESTHGNMTQPIEREEQFFGAPSVGGGKLDKFTRFVLVPAVRQASDETNRKGTIDALVSMIVLRKINSREDVRRLQDEIARMVAEVFNNDNLSELRTLGQEVSRLLQQYAPASGFELQFSDPTVPTIGLPEAIPSLIEHSFRCPIDHAGHGLQRCLILTLLHHLAMIREPSETQQPGSEVWPAPPAANPDLIIAIEEPELYLHPNRCRYLSQLFMALTSTPHAVDGGRNQIIYATHSPYFVDLSRFDQIRIARRVSDGSDSPLVACLKSFTRLEASQQLAAVTRSDPSRFSAESFQAHASNVMTAAVNEGFFADKVVVVEGPSEYGALMQLQEIMNCGWAGKDIAVIPAQGKNNIDRPVIIFKGLGIPIYFVFDGDAGKRGEALEATKLANRRLLRLANASEVDLPASGAFPNYAVFYDNLESEISLILGGADYNSFRDRVARHFGYDEGDVLKNADCTAMFVRLVYESGGHLPILEQIVEHIDALTG